jgi:tripartite-type tricarboxylate transporter receptor subunit TctC
MKKFSIFVSALLAFAGATGLHAQGAWPAKPLKLIVPVTTGGPSDLVARISVRS